MVKIATAFILAVALTSCASVSVVDNVGLSQPTAPPEQQMPVRIYVMAFSTAHADFKVDRTGKELADFKKNLQLMLKTAMVTDLCNRLIATEPGKDSDESRHENAWLVRGQFTTVYQGSRLLRGAVGFGLGATKVETRVEVYDLTNGLGAPFLDFTTTGGSNAEPGAVTAVATDPLTIAIEAVTGGAGNVAHGLTEDTKRTAREITAEFSDYMYKHKWIGEDRWIKPKRPGGGDVW